MHDVAVVAYHERLEAAKTPESEAAHMDWRKMFFQDGQGIVRTMVVGLLAYAVLVLVLRISGKRTLAKLHAFDLVVTVALGSTLSAIVLQESVALAEGAVALALLIIAQYAVRFTSVRSRAVANLVRSEPALLAKTDTFAERPCVGNG